VRLAGARRRGAAGAPRRPAPRGIVASANAAIAAPASATRNTACPVATAACPPGAPGSSPRAYSAVAAAIAIEAPICRSSRLDAMPDVHPFRATVDPGFRVNAVMRDWLREQLDELR
jgi:hypothetical protein